MAKPTMTWRVTQNRDGVLEIPDSLFPDDIDTYPSTRHIVGFVDGPDDDDAWNDAWLNQPLVVREDTSEGTTTRFVRPEGSSGPWLPLHAL